MYVHVRWFRGGAVLQVSTAFELRGLIDEAFFGEEMKESVVQ